VSPGQGHEPVLCLRFPPVQYSLRIISLGIIQTAPSRGAISLSIPLLSLRSQTTSEPARSEISLTGHDIS